eukprot:TRINITY_DN6900_c0_g1_i3.p1 TRINITY_DN6900_c0_g1~~TRINITY_DN6900_c0_g1_i3.p1  ORF type:complete len:128 (+),score=14.26 TRINITY_DN6900_c0_g1_i3:25-408(+)
MANATGQHADLDATIRAVELTVDHLRITGLQTLNIQSGQEAVIPQQLESLVKLYKDCEKAIEGLPEDLTVPPELIEQVDKGISPDVFDAERLTRTTTLASQMHSSTNSLRTLHSQLEQELKDLKNNI